MSAALNPIHVLLAELKELRASCLAMEEEFADCVSESKPESRRSVINLLHYLGLRRHDLRELQSRLGALGLSSLGRTEPSVMVGLDAVIDVLTCLAGEHYGPVREDAQQGEGSALLASHATELLGEAPTGRAVRIMVTMPSEAAANYGLIKGLVEAGMDVMRVNCAHDTELEWDSMIRHLHRANEETGKHCRVLMDLAGPKLRTGSIHRGFHVIRWRVERNVRGGVVKPARIVLAARSAGEAEHSEGVVRLIVPEALVSAAKPGDTFRVHDCRGKTRKLTVIEKAQHLCVCTCEQGGYVIRGAEIALVREGREIDAGHVGDLPLVEEPIRLRTGDQLILTREGSHLPPARRRLPHVTCTLEEVFSKVAAGQPIFFDDGKIEGRVHEAQPDYIAVEILHAGAGEAKLGSAKGINLPETDLGIPAMTSKDRQDLDFIAEHADMVGMSFVNNPEDVVDLQRELAARGKTAMGIILKIETRSGFERLPMIMIAALRHHPAGIMVARGDLAVEVGFERLAEVQEEILWLSEAAHMPVIWATQVLETLAKTGMPSRAEVTDAAMGVRAECVMLNKGEHIVEAVLFLDHILHRMKAHHLKKRSMLRRLAVAQISHAETKMASAD